MAIRKRNGKWYFDFMIRSIRYRSVIPAARTKQDALKAEAEARQAVHEGRYKQQSVPTNFKDFVDRVYFPWAKANKKSWVTDGHHLKPICAFFGKYEIDQISPILVEKFKREMMAREWKPGYLYQPQTINHFLKCVSRIFEIAIDAGIISVNPTRRVRKLRCDNRRLRFLTRDELTKLLDLCVGRLAHMGDVIRVAVNTGMRRGEILGLRWYNVDLVKREIYVEKTKTGRPRIIPVNPELMEVFTRLKEKSRSEYVLTFGKAQKPIQHIDGVFRRLFRAAGIENFHFHDFRHTTPTWLAEQGVDPFTIAEILGHSSIQMSMRYTHVSGERKRQALDGLSQGCHKSEKKKVG